MRIWIVALLLLSTLGLIAAAQPPRLSGDPPAIVIKPMRPGESAPDQDPIEKSGFIVIRPNGRTATATQVGDPKQTSPTTRTPSTPTGTPIPGILNIPPPGDQPAAVADKEGKPLFDYWFAVGIDGQRAGYINWAAKEKVQNEMPFVMAVRYLNLTVSRFGQTISQWGEESDVELPNGTILLTSMRRGAGKDQALALSGRVKDKKLIIKLEGMVKGESEIPWPDGVVGLAREPRLFKELNLKAGESFDYPSYVPTVNWVSKTTITFDGEEAKVLWPNTPPRKLLKFTSKPAPIISQDGGKVKLPASMTWVDASTFEPLMLETDFPALGGRLTFLRTTKDAANAPITRPVEVFNAQSIPLKEQISGIHNRGSVVYKVTLPRDDEPETVFAVDARQKTSKLDEKAHTFELLVSASHGPDQAAPAQPEPGKEFLESNFFINWDNKDVKNHAAAAIVGLPARAGAWEKAVAVERWVKLNMKAFEFDQDMVTADVVARTLKGDCKQYAMLAAAMCRAVGVPSRTALGVVYAPARDGKIFMAYHMWYEVYANGQWLPLDATLGFGGIGPGHIKITDHNWYEEKSFAPLLPVLRALCAKPSMEVVKVTP